jgi:hypothetical protein
MVLFLSQKQDHMTGDHRPNAAVSVKRDPARARARRALVCAGLDGGLAGWRRRAREGDVGR